MLRQKYFYRKENETRKKQKKQRKNITKVCNLAKISKT